jgi:hypothetical protein
MSQSKSGGFVKLTAVLTGLLITVVIFRSLVFFSDADQLPAQAVVNEG